MQSSVQTTGAGTVIGEYQRLGAVAVGSFPVLMSGELERHLFNGIGFDHRVDDASREVTAAFEKQLSGLAKQLGEKMRADVQSNPCRFDALNWTALTQFAERDWQRALSASGTGAATGVISAKLLAKQATAAVAGKLAAKKAFQAAASMAGKVVAKKGGAILLASAGATAVCSPAGPFAVLCGIAAGAVTWLTIDKALITIDELRFRAEMRAEILETVGEQRAALAKDLQEMHDAAIDQITAMVSESTNRVFIPLRDGL